MACRCLQLGSGLCGRQASSGLDGERCSFNGICVLFKKLREEFPENLIPSYYLWLPNKQDYSTNNKQPRMTIYILLSLLIQVVTGYTTIPRPAVIRQVAIRQTSRRAHAAQYV